MPASTNDLDGHVARMHAPDLQSAPLAAGAAARAVSRRELFLWVAGILAANCLLRVDGPPAGNVTDALVHALTSWSVLHYVGWYALFQLLADADRSEPASSLDIAFCLFATLLPFCPLKSSGWLAATLTSAYLFATSERDSKPRAAAMVLMALAVNGLWARQFFDFFALLLLRADTNVVALALWLTQPGITWHDTIIASERHSIVVYGQCSSFHNISLSLLCWIALSKLARTSWALRDALPAALICATVVVCNTIRLYYMALSPEQYAYWHAGFGAQLFAWGMPVIVIGIASWGALRGEHLR